MFSKYIRGFLLKENTELDTVARACNPSFLGVEIRRIVV
jgi:hypothetical protein